MKFHTCLVIIHYVPLLNSVSFFNFKLSLVFKHGDCMVLWWVKNIEGTIWTKGLSSMTEWILPVHMCNHGNVWFYKLSMLHQDTILNTISHTLRFTPFTVILFVCLCLSFFKVLRYQWVLLKVLYTFLFVALSPGAALAYSGCEGSFSTNNLIPNRDTQLTIPVQDT